MLHGHWIQSGLCRYFKRNRLCNHNTGTNGNYIRAHGGLFRIDKYVCGKRGSIIQLDQLW
jgi:hypothetical protein